MLDSIGEVTSLKNGQGKEPVQSIDPFPSGRNQGMDLPDLQQGSSMNNVAKSDLW